MKMILVIAVLCLFSLGANAEEKLNGAFGLVLGDTFEVTSSIGRGKLTDGTPMYQFNPKKRFRSFSKYYALITPRSKKIYGIWGVGTMENSPACKKEQALVMSILQNKYGKPNKDGLTASLFDIKNIDQGNRSVLTKCSGFGEVTLDIRYRDKKLAVLAENERIMVESEKLDSSGL